LEASGNFHDLTVGAATPIGELPAKPLSPDQGDSGFLQRFPFVKTTDAIAGAIGLPRSQEVEALAKQAKGFPWMPRVDLGFSASALRSRVHSARWWRWTSVRPCCAK